MVGGGDDDDATARSTARGRRDVWRQCAATLHEDDALMRDSRDDLVAGVVAGAACTVVGHPFDTVKVLMQRDGARGGGARGGAMMTTRALYASQGARGFYAGVAAPLIGASTETAFNYVAYHRARAYALGARTGEALTASRVERAAASAFAGAFAGATMSAMLTPFELVKCRAQVGYGDGSVLRCASDIVRAHGARGLFRGFSHTLAREVACGAAYFAAWDVAQSFVPRGVDTDSASIALNTPREALAFEAIAAVVCGGASGVVAWSVALPLDNAKTLFQCANPGDAHDAPPMKLLSHIYRANGLRGLYAGARPILARAFPANAAQWLAFEAASRALHDRRRRLAAAADAAADAADAHHPSSPTPLP